MGNLDQTKHDIDVMERVFGGVSTSAVTDEGRTRIVGQDVRWRRWLGVGDTASVQITVDDGESSDR